MTREHQKYSAHKSALLISSLTTYPRFQANLLRIEQTLYSVLENSRGHRRPGRGTLARWLNRVTSRDRDPHVLEDPVEDVFLGNVATEHGNFRIFMGNWQYNDHYLQTMIDCLVHTQLPKSIIADLFRATIALLKLSDQIANRLNLTRWCTAESHPGKPMILPSTSELACRAQAIVFSSEDLVRLKIDSSDLNPFILNRDNRTAQSSKDLMKTYLERYPLLANNDNILVISPHDISAAIRHRIIFAIKHHREVRNLIAAILNHQALRVRRDVFQEFRSEIVPIDGPSPENEMPPLFSSLLRYDNDKAIHVVVITDTLLNISTGFDAFHEFPSNQSQGLSMFLNNTASCCLSTDWCNEGFTILVAAGVGRSIVPQGGASPVNWHYTALNIYDLLYLSDRHDGSVEKYLKFARQKHELELQGVEFAPSHLCEDICLFSYWTGNDYSLIPRGSDGAEDNAIFASGAWLLETRKESRLVADRHVELGVDQTWHLVKRLSINSYFQSRLDVPTYVSLDSLSDGVLSGVTAADSGTYWLHAIGVETSRSLREVQFYLWEGILDLLFVILDSIEGFIGQSDNRIVEIRLDFSQMAALDEILSESPKSAAVICDFRIDAENRVLQLTFGRECLKSFLTADDSGEREILTTIIGGLLQLGEDGDECLVESRGSQVYDELFPEGTLRLLHLLSGASGPPLIGPEWPEVFLVKDEELSAMRRTVARGDRLKKYANTSLDTVAACNAFLHDLVDWYWSDIKQALSGLDRGTLIQMLLTFHESIIEDRVRWQIASRSLVAIHGSSGEPILAARSLERRRARTAVAIRALLEMAVCECPYDSRNEIPQLEIDRLVARVSLSMGIENGTVLGIENGTLRGGLEIGTRHPGPRGGSGATGAGAGVLGLWIVMTAPRSGLARR